MAFAWRGWPKPPTPDQNDPEHAAINQLLFSGAPNPPPADTSARPHPLIRHTANLLRSRSRKDEHGILLPREASGLDVKVREGTLERALLPMGQVLAVLERQGARVENSEQGRTTALLNGDHVSFGIEEPIRRVVTQKPRAPNPTDRWDDDKIVKYEPGGKLALVIHPPRLFRLICMRPEGRARGMMGSRLRKSPEEDGYKPMKNARLKSTRRSFLKMAALGGSLPANAAGNYGRNLGRTLDFKSSTSSPTAHPALAASGKMRQRLDRAALSRAVSDACDWLTDVASMKADALAGENNSHKLEHRHWRGALRGEYRVSTRQWDFFCPVWHTGQAVKALVWASRALKRPELLDAARFSAEFIGAERVADRSDPHYGLIFGFEDFGDRASTSAGFESVDGLWLLADATGDSRYAEWAGAAAAWEARYSYLGDGLFRDQFDVKTWRHVPPPAGADKPGRPLNDDAIFLKAAARGGKPELRTIFYEVADRLLREEDPPGNWIGFGPCNAATGMIHPRQAYWWGRPMIDAFRGSRDPRYLACGRRAGEWYRKAMRLDGGLFRGTRRDFQTDSFGHATSGVACAVLLWQDLWQETHDQMWIDSIRTGLNFCLQMQFHNVSDPNLKGALIEAVEAPDGSDASPYYLRDLSTIFFVQAASRLLTEQIPA
jgi:hypothetical protein